MLTFCVHTAFLGVDHGHEFVLKKKVNWNELSLLASSRRHCSQSQFLGMLRLYVQAGFENVRDLFQSHLSPTVNWIRCIFILFIEINDNSLTCWYSMVRIFSRLSISVINFIRILMWAEANWVWCFYGYSNSFHWASESSFVHWHDHIPSRLWGYSFLCCSLLLSLSKRK
jgi:hypothetical protein